MFLKVIGDARARFGDLSLHCHDAREMSCVFSGD
jgi:hypothetical protein